MRSRYHLECEERTWPGFDEDGAIPDYDPEDEYPDDDEDDHDFSYFDEVTRG